MSIQNMLQELYGAGVIEPHMKDTKALSGGTSSSLFAVLDHGNPVCVIKLNDMHTIQAESQYLKTYADIELLPRLLYVEKSYQYLVYTFKTGTTQYIAGNKSELMRRLAGSFIRNYKVAEEGLRYGYMDEPHDSWGDFQLARAQEARTVIGDWLTKSDHQLIQSLIRDSERTGTKYLLHGDCGVHNFLFQYPCESAKDNKSPSSSVKKYAPGHLTGIIDPTPVVGEPIYDLVYAFCSTPDELDSNVIRTAAQELPIEFTEGYKLSEEVLKGLYFRLAACLRHHPRDIDEYVSAWSQWKKRV